MCLPASLLIAPSRLPDLRSRFCWFKNEPGSTSAVGLFRRSFDVTSIPESFQISVTADNRYVLWLNGTRLGRGPLKGTLEHYQVETYELAPLLRVGRNVLAA